MYLKVFSLLFFSILILFLIKIKTLKTNFFGRNSIIDIVLRFLGINCLEGWRVCCLDFVWFSLEIIIVFINITINFSHIIGIAYFLVDKLFLLFLWQIVLAQIVLIQRTVRIHLVLIFVEKQLLILLLLNLIIELSQARLETQSCWIMVILQLAIMLVYTLNTVSLLNLILIIYKLSLGFSYEVSIKSAALAKTCRGYHVETISRILI